MKNQLSLFEMSTEFNEHENALPKENVKELYKTLIEEEYEELQEELEKETVDREKLARELADVIYVSAGIAWAYDIDIDIALKEIHEAAIYKMNKNIRRADGKIVKPPGFIPPSMKEACEIQETQ